VNCLTDAERDMLTGVRKVYEARIKVGCTGCEYCMPCPQEVNIPHIFRGYDQAHMFGGLDRFFERYREQIPDFKCVSCGACVAVCPQHFVTPIPDMLRLIFEESKKH
jgi:predicted aldo/keto reductase-like oxidoreductase